MIKTKDMNKIAVIRIEFHEMSDLILTKEEYEEMGGWKGFLKNYAMSIRDVAKVHHEMIDAKDFPTTEWDA